MRGFPHMKIKSCSFRVRKHRFWLDICPIFLIFHNFVSFSLAFGNNYEKYLLFILGNCEFIKEFSSKIFRLKKYIRKLSLSIDIILSSLFSVDALYFFDFLVAFSRILWTHRDSPSFRVEFTDFCCIYSLYCLALFFRVLSLWNLLKFVKLVSFAFHDKQVDTHIIWLFKSH